MLKQNLRYLINVRAAKVIVVLMWLIEMSVFLIKPWKSVLLPLNPILMVISIIFLMCFHESKKPKNWLGIAGIALVGFSAELIGVNTHLIFGSYTYGNLLGPKLWNTPLAIGLNWLVLIYCITALAKPIRETWYFPIVGASVMVAYDWIIEPVAITTGMWSWAGETIPIKNYTDWFLISGFLFLMIRILKLEINNRIAGMYIIMQFVFFLVMNLFIRIN